MIRKEGMCHRGVLFEAVEKGAVQLLCSQRSGSAVLWSGQCVTSNTSRRVLFNHAHETQRDWLDAQIRRSARAPLRGALAGRQTGGAITSLAMAPPGCWSSVTKSNTAHGTYIKSPERSQDSVNPIEKRTKKSTTTYQLTKTSYSTLHPPFPSPEDKGIMLE